MPASDAQRLKTAHRRSQNLQLKLAGLGWDEIAERLGYSGKAAACKDFARALEQTRSTIALNAEELREIEMLRLDRVRAGSWKRALSGDPKSADIVLKVHDRVVKLHDLTGAQRVVGNAVDAWIDSLRGGTLDPEDQAALDAVS